MPHLVATSTTELSYQVPSEEYQSARTRTLEEVFSTRFTAHTASAHRVLQRARPGHGVNEEVTTPSQPMQDIVQCGSGGK